MSELESPAFESPEKIYLRYLSEGKFMIQRSKQSGAYVFYPRIAEPGTGAELDWVEASGRAVVYSSTMVRQRPPTPNYNVSLIDLAEGPRLMSRVIGLAAEDVKIGMKVRAKIIQENDAPLLVFEPEV